jgi:hypothetical protein
LQFAFDYQSIDPSQGRLYIAHMNADQLVVFDVKKREAVANLDGFANVHGVLAVVGQSLRIGDWRAWPELKARTGLPSISPPDLRLWREKKTTS